MMNFQLHPRLQQDCITIGRFELCRLLIMNDRQYPWFILVPEISNLTELYQLDKTQYTVFMEESCYLAENLAALFEADKMNIANIGNIVAQLHIHHIVRYQTDSAWPTPVWGKFAAVPYTEAQITERVSQVTARLSEKLQLIE